MQSDLSNSKPIGLNWILGENRLKNYMQERLAAADVQINGNRPWDIQVHNPKFYQRVLLQGSLGLGESYVEGWWDCQELDQFFIRILREQLHEQVAPNNEKMLDKRLTYSCGYWKDAQTLDEAQEAKLDLICRKLQLEPGMTVLDIGCGWGSFMKYAAEKYGVECVGLTVSQEQVKLGEEMCRGLPVKFLLQDYRTFKGEGKCDRVVSVGMFEHVGYKNYRTFMEVVRSCLSEDGLFLLHTVGNLKTVTYGELWLVKYIFPRQHTFDVSDF